MKTRNQTLRLVEALKSILKARRMTYRQLAVAMGLSETSLKRTFSQGTFTLKRIEEICGILEIDFYDLARIARGRVQDVVESLNLEQEKALGHDPALFTLFYLLLSGMTLKQIDKEFDFQGRTETLVLKLDRLRLLEVHPQQRIKLLVTTNVRWLPRGPLSEKYEHEIKKEFLGAPFIHTNEKLRLLSGYFSEQALRTLNNKIEKLLGEFIDLSEKNVSLEAGSGQRQWLLLAYRPWTFSMMDRYQRGGKK